MAENQGSIVQNKPVIKPSELTNLKEEFKQQEKTAFITGYTGTIGSLLLERLIEENVFKKIVLIGRRKVDYKDEKFAALEQRIVDFDRLDEHRDAFADCHVGYNCLGMTVGLVGALQQETSDLKKKVDRDYPVNAAKITKGQGCEQFHFVSGAGVDPKSSNKFLKNKGIAEDEIKDLNFDKYIIYRPAYVRMENRPKRWYEYAYPILKPIDHLFPYKISVKGTTLINAMIYKTVAQTTKPGQNWECLENKQICTL